MREDRGRLLHLVERFVFCDTSGCYMEMIQWAVFFCSMLLGFGWLAAGLLLTLPLLAVSLSGRSARPLCIVVGSLFMGGASFVHMLMVALQREIGVPERLYAHYVISGVSFGDLATGRFASLEMGVAACGVMSAVIGGFFLPAMITRIVSQLENIPVSKAGSAAIGLAGFKGVARPADQRPADIYWSLAHIPAGDFIVPGDSDTATPEEYILVDEKRLVTYRSGGSVRTEEANLRKWSLFYLEDESGRILVDPRRIHYGELSLTPLSMGDPQSLYLARNWEATRHRQGSRAFLKAGDYVYVIGTVQTNGEAPPDAKDSDRLVVRPKQGYSPKTKSAMRDSLLLTGNIEDIFVLTDDTEHHLAHAMRSWRKPVFFAAFVLLTVSALHLGYYLVKIPFS